MLSASRVREDIHMFTNAVPIEEDHAALHTGPGTRHPRRWLRDLLGPDECPDRAEALQPRKARLLRVRHRAHSAARRWRPVPGPLLHHRDDVHRLRHRDRVPLPDRGGLRPAAALRTGRDDLVHRPRLRRLRVRVATWRSRMGLEEKLPSGVLLTTVE